MYKAIMIMGVSGCGKSTVGTALARTFDGVFLDGDDYHPNNNVEHMAAGKPLTDAMRWPWLDLLAAAVNGARRDQVAIFACSALKKSYRDHLRGAIPDLTVVHLAVPRDVVAARLDQRKGHYMPPSLLSSQYETLEVPDSTAITVCANQPVDDIVKSLAGLA